MDKFALAVRPLFASKAQGLVVFDLDSTLFNVTKRTEKILRDFSQLAEVNRAFPDQAEKLAQVVTRHDEWGIRQAVERAGVDDPDFFTAIRDFWVEHFFSSTYLKYDTPYEGAQDFVNHIYEHGHKILYLTGRDHENMLAGTIESLQQWGFPYEDEQVSLQLKPNKEVTDEDYKIEVLSQCEQKPIWFFENEPVIINRTLNSLKDVQIIVMDSVHSGREEAPNHLMRLQMSFLHKP